jgi:hypothetical protein
MAQAYRCAKSSDHRTRLGWHLALVDFLIQAVGQIDRDRRATNQALGEATTENCA